MPLISIDETTDKTTDKTIVETTDEPPDETPFLTSPEDIWIDRCIESPSPTIIKTLLNNDIVDLLTNFVNDKFQIDKLKVSINISDKSVKLITLLLKASPEIFTKMANDIHIILSDGVLDLADLPQIIVLIKDIYNTNFKKIGKNIKNISINDSIDFIKDLILIMVELNYIIVDNKRKIIKMVESSVNLLSSSILIAPTLFNLCCGCC